MKIKQGFVTEKLGGSYVAVATGELADNFHGYIRLNATAAFLFDLCKTKDRSEEELVAELLKEYDATEEQALCGVRLFVKTASEGGLFE